MQTVLSVLETKGSTVRTVESTACVCEAVALMNVHNIGALLVEEESSVVGIFTERDVLVRVVSAERDPKLVTVAEVMTTELVTIPPHASVEDAMRIMVQTQHRHLQTPRYRVRQSPKPIRRVSYIEKDGYIVRNSFFRVLT